MYTKLTENAVCAVIRNDSTGMFIPVDSNNRHYQEYLAWLAEPNTPEEEEI